MHGLNIGIIGGGPSGLMLAYQLFAKACSPPLFGYHLRGERPAGRRILTNRFASAPVSYEASTPMYDYSVVGEDALRKLIAELGLFTRPMAGATVILDNHVLANADDIRDRLGPTAWRALQAFDRSRRDWMSPKEFYHADWKEGDGVPQGRMSFHSVLSEIPDDRARRFVQTMVHSDLATEPALTNGSYGLQNYLMNDPAYMRLYSIDGGIERLPQEIAKRLHATILLETPVMRVEKTPDGKLRITSLSRPAPLRVSDFDFVVDRPAQQPAADHRLGRPTSRCHAPASRPVRSSCTYFRSQHSFREAVLATAGQRFLFHARCVRRLLSL